ncbi:MAG: translation initiation factor IF-3 [Cyanobacteria bacterium]|nr:translation initiation factor IF-3 [Cyanobacteriota bacterium]
MINGEENSVVTREHALQLAQQQGLDLIVVSLESSPPVVRLVDYGKFKFESEKKAREAKKKQHVVEVKEIKMGIRIDDHDYLVKLSHAQKFLQSGNKVKASIRLKGREVQHTNLAFDLAHKFIVDLQDYGAQEGQLRLEGKTITINVNPIKQQSKSSGDKDSHAQDENP